jgi:eukaryotic-like serine/threonine-protein kinase
VIEQVCLDDVRVKAFVSMTLSDDARRAVEDHVDDCDDCRRMLVALVRSSAPGSPPPDASWQAGSQVGRYVVTRSVGRGAMGEVFRADDQELKRPVALKRLHATGSADSRARLVREARAAAQLQHPNVVAVYEIVTDGEAAVLACEWIDGVTLREHCAGKAWRDVVQVVVGAGRGLAAAHAAGIVHRDFKPENVLVDREGRARVADFGLASGFEAAERESVRPLAVTPLRITMTGTVAGTPAYMAPELIDGALPDARSDQFSFAVTLFEMVYGKYPYAGATAEAIWAQMATQTIVKTERRVPAWLDRAIRKGLSADPKHRFEHLDALLDRIDRKSRRGIGIPLAVAGAIGGVAVAGLLMALPSRSEAPPCGEQLVDEVWSQAARAAYARQFTLVAPSRSAASLAFADEALAQWAGSWRLGRRAACTAAPKERSARTTCLDRQLIDLSAQLSVWSRADASVVDRTAASLALLPSPVECTSAVASAPVSAALVASAAEVDALRRVGKYQEARPKLAALATLAANETDPITKARAFFAAGSVEFELRDHVNARTHFAIAAQAARQAGDDRLLAETLLLDAATRTIADKPAEALGLCDAVQSMMLTSATAARLEAVRGEALTVLGRHAEAVAAYQRGVAILEKEVGRDPALRMQLARTIGAAGSAMGLAGQHAEGLAELARCLAMEEPIHGPDHPEVGRTLFDMANLDAKLGNADTATARYTRARAIFLTALGDDSLEVAAVDAALGYMALHDQRFDEAYKLTLSARDIYRAKATLALLSSVETTLGNIMQDQDKCAQAIPHYEAALVAAKDAGQTGSPLGISYANVGGCLYDVGKRDAEARNALETALAAFDSDPDAGPERAHTLAVLGNLEARQGRYKQAIEMGERALAILKDVKDPMWEQLRGHITDSFVLWRRGRHE